MLTVEYPEDQSRTIYVCNWGCETALGFATGQSIGDVLKGKYVPTCPESLKYPLSGKMQTWAQLFYLHDRFPEIKRPKDIGVRPLTPDDGFWVILAQTPSFQAPLGAGTAISKICLYEVKDPDTLADLKKIIDLTIVKYKDKANFLGAWIRQRPTAMPMSFNEKDIKLFCAEANDGARITRAHIQANKELLEKYYAWWFGKRKAFLGAIRDQLRTELGPDAFVLYTNDPSEPGKALPRSITGEGQENGWQWMLVVINDQMSTWEKILADATNYKFVKPYDYKTVVDKDLHLRSLHTFAENWDAKYEINHCMPPDDPEKYQDADGLMFSYTYNRLYTVSSPRTMAPYRSKTSLALMRHYSLNENDMNIGNVEPLGYFMCDVERAGPYCMMAEARAIANGDPTLLGALPGGSNKRGFPGYVRRFHAAFLSLPALPSEVVADAASDPEVVVRTIKTDKHGTWYSIVNTGFGTKKDVVVKLPPGGKLRDSATGASLQTSDGKLTLSLDPAELRAMHVQ